MSQPFQFDEADLRLLPAQDATDPRVDFAAAIERYEQDFDVADEPDGEQHIRQMLFALHQYISPAQDGDGASDTDAALVVLAAATSSTDGGDEDEPCWPMIVGPSSEAKTEMLNLVAQAPDVVERDDLTVAGLLGIKREKGVPKLTGLLVKAGATPTLILVKDFSTMLGGGDKSGNAKMELFNFMRVMYDGKATRENYEGLGSWQGRITCVAACTPAIDTFSTYAGALGSRFINYRMPDRTLTQKMDAGAMTASRKALKLHRAEASAHAVAAVASARGRFAATAVDEEMESLLVECAAVTAFGRVNVPRDTYKREVTGLADIEGLSRTVSQLRTLARGLIALRLKREVVERIVRHVAVSTMPLVRSRCIRTAAQRSGTKYAIGKAIGAPDPRVAERALEDLEAAGLIRRTVTDDDVHWSVSEDWQRRVQDVFHLRYEMD